MRRPTPVLPNTPNYTASISSVQFQSANPATSSSNTYGWSPLYATLPTTCPSPNYANSPQLVTVGVTYKGTTSNIQTVVDDPTAVNPITSCSSPSKLVFTQQPTNGGPNAVAGNAGSALSPPISVTIEDSSNNPCGQDAAGVTLNITPGAGPSGSSLQGCALTQQNGTSSFSGCEINNPGTGYTLTASDTTDNSPQGLTAVSNAFAIGSGVPTQLVFSTQPGNGTGGTALKTQPIVRVEDSQGNLMTSDASTVTLAIGANPGNGTLSNCTAQAIGGVATFTNCSIDKIGNNYTLTATDVADNLTTPSTASSPFNITVGPPAQLAFTTSPGTGVAGDKFAVQPVVAIEDAGGNVVTTDTNTVALTIGANPGNGTLSGCSTSKASAGIATFSACSINNVGNGYTLTAADSTDKLTGQSAAFNLVAPVASSFSIVPSTNTPTAGTQFSAQITALDQSGYTFTGYTGTQVINFTGPSSSPNKNAPVYPASVSFAGGVGTAKITVYDAQATTLTAAQGSITGSAAITVGSTGTATAYSVANPGSQTAGIQFGVSISAVDTYGNVVTGYTGTKTLTFSGPGSLTGRDGSEVPDQWLGDLQRRHGHAQRDPLQRLDLDIDQPDRHVGQHHGLDGCLHGDRQRHCQLLHRDQPRDSDCGHPVQRLGHGRRRLGQHGNGVHGQSDAGLQRPGDLAGRQRPELPDRRRRGLQQRLGHNPDHPLQVLDHNELDPVAEWHHWLDGHLHGEPGRDQHVQRGQPGDPDGRHRLRRADHGHRRLGQHHAELHRQPDAVLQRCGERANGTAPKYPTSGVVSFSAGVGTATMTLYDGSTTTNVTATQGSLTDTTGIFTVNGGATAVSFSVANPGTQTAGTQFGLSIAAIDTWGNTATGYTGTKTLTFSGPGSSPGGTAPKYPTNGSVTFSAGTATPNVTLYNASASTNLTVTLGSITGSTGAFNVTGSASANSFTVTNPGTQTAGTPFNVSVTAVDAWGNTATAYTGNQTLGFSGPGTSPGGNAPSYPTGGVVGFNNGSATIPITLYKSSTTTNLTLSQSGTTGSTGTFTVSPAGTSTFNVANPGTQTAGIAFGVPITATDAWGNTTRATPATRRCPSAVRRTRPTAPPPSTRPAAWSASAPASARPP